MSDLRQVTVTIDELTLLILQNSRRAKANRQAGEALLQLAAEDEKLTTVYLEVAKRFKRDEEAKESKMNLKRVITSLMVVVLMAMLATGSIIQAQDVPEATVEATINGQPVDAIVVDATAEPTQDVISVPEQPGGTLIVGWTAISNFIVIVIGAMAAGFGVSLGVILVIVRGVRSNDLIKDALQKIYMSQPVEIREKQREIIELAKEGVELLDEVTAGEIASDVARGIQTGMQ